MRSVNFFIIDRCRVTFRGKELASSGLAAMRRGPHCAEGKSALLEGGLPHTLPKKEDSDGEEQGGAAGQGETS